MAMLSPGFQIKITDEDSPVRYVRAVSKITVNLSRERPTDSAEIHLPGAKKADLKMFQEGQGIRISFGYEGEKAEMRTVFTGKITWVSPSLPLVIKAEDAFHAAKHVYVNQTYCKEGERMYYSEIAEDVLGKAGLTAYIPKKRIEHDYQARDVKFEEETVAQAMAKLSADIQWVHFCIPGTEIIYFGPDWPYHRGLLPQEGQASPKILYYRIGSGTERSAYDSGKQFPETWGNVISAADLKYRTRKPFAQVTCNLIDTEQRYTSVEAKHPETLAKEGKVEAEPAKKSFTFPYSFDQGKEQAEKHAKMIAEAKYHEVNAPQYTGSFTTFGNPFLSHSHRIRLESVEHPERDDYYDVKAVTFNYSPTGGFRMTVEVRKPPDGMEEGA